MITKYTTDGKKVGVVGKLNSEETIVQEIFVSETEQEIPSGENFVVKSLHDSPVVSWKEKKLKELEQRFDEDRKSWEDKIDRQNKTLQERYTKSELVAKYLFNFSKNSSEDQLVPLIKFLSGEITHYFIMNDYDPHIFSLSDDNAYMTDSYYGRKKIENLKLISLNGKSNGDLSYNIHRYSDGSGGGSYEIKLCSSYEEALSFAQEYLDRICKEWLDEENKRHSVCIDRWKKVEGIKIPKKAQKKIDEINHKSKLEKIEKLEKELIGLREDE